jgi:transcriptional regulator with XRE-family HTH domain
MNRQQLAERLRAARIARGYSSARAFATRVGLDNSMVSRIEKMADDPDAPTSRDPSLRTLERWADACGLELSFNLRDSSEEVEHVDLPPRVAAVARLAAGLSEAELDVVAQLVRGLPELNQSERDALAGMFRLAFPSKRQDRAVR